MSRLTTWLLTILIAGVAVSYAPYVVATSSNKTHSIVRAYKSCQKHRQVSELKTAPPAPTAYNRLTVPKYKVPFVSIASNQALFQRPPPSLLS